ncbi:MAG: adenine deaminase [Phycisphaerae bacterium]|nr:adenine deaminase [Phycisphaerae bacterium]
MSDNLDRDLIDVAAGRRPAELVLRNARLVNVVSNEVHDAEIALFRGRIAGITGGIEADETLDLQGRHVCPGFIDAHVHIESSMLAVPEYARVVAACGTTAVVADPHEFANVMGAAGISYVLRTSEHAPIRVFVMLSSCVPASPLESAGANMSAEDLRPFLNDSRVLGLAEMMNYPGVVHGDAGVLAKLEMCRGRIIDGHAPSLSGRDLNAYCAAGILSDHECIRAEEAAEKLRLGLTIMIREGSQTRNLKALAPLVTPATAGRFLFCTDDKDVRDLLDEGHIDFMIRSAIAEGLDPILAVRLATWNSARYFGLRDSGAILPGYRADLVVLDDLRECRVAQTYVAGRLVAEGGRCIATAAQPIGDDGRNTVHVRPLTHSDLQIPASGDQSCHVHVIEVLDNRIDTERSVDHVTIRGGELLTDPARDLAKMIVVERHRSSGEIGRGFARGFKLHSGAIGSSVAHDAHNLISVGTNDQDILAALQHIQRMQGGWVVIDKGRVLADVPLPIAGLVTDAPAATAAEQLRILTEAARTLGCEFAQPFMCLAFLSLSVIGKLKLTNKGLIDVEKFAVTDLIVS